MSEGNPDQLELGKTMGELLDAMLAEARLRKRFENLAVSHVSRALGVDDAADASDAGGKGGVETSSQAEVEPATTLETVDGAEFGLRDKVGEVIETVRNSAEDLIPFELALGQGQVWINRRTISIIRPASEGE
jgi:hypothetical protein